MAHHKSALKRQRQNEKRRLRNQSYKSRMKTAIKKALLSLESKDPRTRLEAFNQAQAEIMHVAQKGVIPKKRASRKVSRLAKRLLSAQPQ